jgi:RNase P subunit RPR2
MESGEIGLKQLRLSNMNQARQSLSQTRRTDVYKRIEMIVSGRTYPSAVRLVAKKNTLSLPFTVTEMACDACHELNKVLVSELAICRWIKKGEVLFIRSPTVENSTLTTAMRLCNKCKELIINVF